VEISGVQIPIDYVVVGGVILIASAVLAATRLVSRDVRKEERLTRASASNVSAVLRQLRLMQVEGDMSSTTAQTIQYVKAEESRRSEKLRRYRAVLFALNSVTTIFALIPLAGAIAATIFARPDLALQLNVVGLITLIVTKGGLWLLTMALIPALKAVPAGVGTGVGSYFAQRWLKSREKTREPAEKQ
jgi:hypothetical protein